MPPSPRVLARRWRLVHEAEPLGSTRKAAQDCKATVRVVEKWCRRSKATGTVDDTPWAGMPRAPLASREATLLLQEGVKRGDRCTQLAKMLQQRLGVTVSAEPVHEQVLSSPDEAEEACFTNSQAHARTVMLCQTMGTEVMAQCGCDRQQALLAVQ
jgi:transposase